MSETGWTGEGPEAEDAAEAPAPAIDLSWLPPGVARRQALDEAQHAAQLAREKQATERAGREAADLTRDKAINAYMDAARLRGEDVSVAELMRDQAAVARIAEAQARGEDITAGTTAGLLGRTPAEVLAEKAGLADRIPKEHREPVNYIGDVPAQRSESRGDGWPSSERELERMVRRAEDDRSWMAAYQMRLASRQGRAAEHIEAQRAAAEQAHGRGQYPATRRAVGYYDAGEITRGTEGCSAEEETWEPTSRQAPAGRPRTPYSRRRVTRG